MNWLQTKIPPPILALLSGLTMWQVSDVWQLLPLVPELWQPIGIVLILIGLSLDFSSLINFIRNKTTVNPIKPSNATQLVVTGFYRFSRNPMYLGLLFVLTGSACLFADLSAFLILPVFVMLMNVLQIQAEEVVLEELFADEYRSYKQRVRRWL